MFRPATADDIDAVAALLARDEEHTLGRPSKLTPDDMRAWIGPVDLASDSWLAEENGCPIAFGWLYRRGDLGNGVGVIDPKARGRGFGARLVDTVVLRAKGSGLRRLQYAVLGGDEDGRSLLESRGFRHVRNFYEMGIELDGPPPEPVVPEGMALQTFREEDARALFDALEEAFQDHWEHYPREFDEWWEEKRTQPGYDPTVCFVVRDEAGGIVAASRNYSNRNGGGWIDALGVRRAHRGRGLAKALLHRSFGEFYARGMPRVSLGVDAQNPTGATKLYESVGMKPELEMITFEKALA
jgi:mycothiol synthase